MLWTKSTTTDYIKLNTNFTLSQSYSFHKSSYHKLRFFETIYIPQALNTWNCLWQGDLFYSAGLHRTHAWATAERERERERAGQCRQKVVWLSIATSTPEKQSKGILRKDMTPEGGINLARGRQICQYSWGTLEACAQSDVITQHRN